jgi:threonine/homoserine/homoserine lactone efflux protein
VDWLMILTALFSLMGVASGALLAYVGWLHLRRVTSDRTRALSKKTRAYKTRNGKIRAHTNWPRAVRVS